MSSPPPTPPNESQSSEVLQHYKVSEGDAVTHDGVTSKLLHGVSNKDGTQLYEGLLQDGRKVLPLRSLLPGYLKDTDVLPPNESAKINHLGQEVPLAQVFADEAGRVNAALTQRGSLLAPNTFRRLLAQAQIQQPWYSQIDLVDWETESYFPSDPFIIRLPQAQGYTWLAGHNPLGADYRDPVTNSQNQAFLYWSKDEGRTWKKVLHFEADTNPNGQADGGFKWNKLFLEGGDLYAVGLNHGWTSTGVRKSTDGGKTWTAFSEILPGDFYERSPLSRRFQRRNQNY